MGFNPKKIIAMCFFFLAFMSLLMSVLVVVVENTQNNSNICGTLCCCFIPMAFIFIMMGVFMWSGGKKDELRQAEIDSLKRKQDEE